MSASWVYGTTRWLLFVDSIAIASCKGSQPVRASRAAVTTTSGPRVVAHSGFPSIQTTDAAHYWCHARCLDRGPRHQCAAHTADAYAPLQLHFAPQLHTAPHRQP